MNVRTAAIALVVSLLAATAPSHAAPTRLTGKMSSYNYLLTGKWSCTGGGGTYAAEYSLASGNTLHGHLYSPEGSEDAYFGYTTAAHRYFTVSADSTGATQSQMSSDGITYTGKVNDGKTTSSATNIITMVNAKQWTVRARGTAAGHPYDFKVVCTRP